MQTLDAIAASLQGYDPQALPAASVSAFLQALVSPVTEVEHVGLQDALGRVLAHDTIAQLNVPPHDNSAMDGYAFDGTALGSGAALNLHVHGVAYAGAAWRGSVGPGQCLKIMTGAVMPSGLDTVVPQEFVQVQADGSIRIPAGLLRPGDNRRLAGEDLRCGEVALPQGERIGPAALGLLASLGLASVPVRRRLRVAYFSTGDEILSQGEAPREGAVYDSNRYTLFGLLSRLGVELIDLGVAADNPDALAATFGQAAQLADAILSSGGVSVGEADHTRNTMKQLGDVVFWRIAMRPGRPMAVGRISTDPATAQAHSAIAFGLPGNPVAVMVSFLAFVRPALLQMMGCHARACQPAPLLQARSTQAIRKKPGRTEYQRALVSNAADGQLQVTPIGNQGSGVLSSMVQANGLLVLPHAQGDVAMGELVEVMVFEGALS